MNLKHVCGKLLWMIIVATSNLHSRAFLFLHRPHWIKLLGRAENFCGVFLPKNFVWVAIVWSFIPRRTLLLFSSTHIDISTRTQIRSRNVVNTKHPRSLVNKASKAFSGVLIPSKSFENYTFDFFSSYAMHFHEGFRTIFGQLLRILPKTCQCAPCFCTCEIPRIARIVMAKFWHSQVVPPRMAVEV